MKHLPILLMLLVGLPHVALSSEHSFEKTLKYMENKLILLNETPAWSNTRIVFYNDYVHGADINKRYTYDALMHYSDGKFLGLEASDDNNIIYYAFSIPATFMTYPGGEEPSLATVKIAVNLELVDRESFSNHGSKFVVAECLKAFPCVAIDYSFEGADGNTYQSVTHARPAAGFQFEKLKEAERMRKAYKNLIMKALPSNSPPQKTDLFD